MANYGGIERGDLDGDDVTFRHTRGVRSGEFHRNASRANPIHFLIPYVSTNDLCSTVAWLLFQNAYSKQARQNDIDTAPKKLGLDFLASRAGWASAEQQEDFKPTDSTATSVCQFFRRSTWSVARLAAMLRSNS